MTSYLTPRGWSMRYGLMSHFNACLGEALMAEIAALACAPAPLTFARIETDESSPELVRQMCDEVGRAGLQPLPIVRVPAHIDVLTPLDFPEFENEPDGDVRPVEIRPRFDAVCAAALAKGIPCTGPAISNLDWDTLLWLERLVDAAPWPPPGLTACSFHRYGPSDAQWDAPQMGFASRDAEVARLREIVGPLPLICTETGWSTAGLSEDEQAAYLAREWAFWERHGIPMCVFQLNDGESLEERYGLRTIDGRWKVAATQYGGDSMSEYPLANVCPDALFLRDDLVALEGRPDEFSLRFPIGSDTILSPKVNGQHELRPMSSCGNADETCKVIGGCVVFVNVNGQRLAWRLADA